jgi:hypothetical protein
MAVSGQRDEFQIARHFYADLGCRYFGTDYSSGSFKYNVNLIGPPLELGGELLAGKKIMQKRLAGRFSLSQCHEAVPPFCTNC